jgi:hypothetical protein
VLIETAILGWQFLKCDILFPSIRWKQTLVVFCNTSSMSVVIRVFAELESCVFAGQGFLLKLPFCLKITA